MILSGWIGIHQYTHQPDIFRHGADPPSYPSLVIWLFLFFITLLSCRRLEWISLFLATYFYHMNPEPTSMEPQNAQCGRSSRSSPRDPRGSFGGLKPSKLPKAVPGTCNVATSKNSQLAMDQNSLAHNSLYIYSIKPSILQGDNFEPYPHGFLVDNMGLGGCVLIQELCVRG
jgi:hypothetical protein